MAYLRILSLLSLLFCVTGCADEGALDFQVACERLSKALMNQFDVHSFGQVGATIGAAFGDQPKRDARAFVIDPFIDGDSGNVTGSSTTIERILTSEIVAHGTQYRVVPLDSASVRSSRYVVTGATRYEQYPPTGGKLYRIYGAIIDLQTGAVLANTSIWVANRKIDEEPTPFYKNSPMYLKDQTVQRQIDVAVAAAGAAPKQYVDTLDAAAMTHEGSVALEHADFHGAAQFFSASLRLPDGQTMKNYSGLYQAYYRMNDKPDAEAAFYKMFALGVASNEVKIKFLFSVGRTDFTGDANLRAQYDLWLRQIASYLNAAQVCMIISGHASHTGTADYNHKLSLERAQRIQAILTAQAPGLAAKLSSVGRGFDENIVGSGTDDDQDAVDRRVEFRPQACSVT